MCDIFLDSKANDHYHEATLVQGAFRRASLSLLGSLSFLPHWHRQVGFLLIVGGLLSSQAVPSRAQTFCDDLTGCLKNLQSNDVATKSDAIFTLGRLKAKRAVPHLAKVALQGPNLHVRRSAIRALGAIGDPSAVAALAKFLKEKPKLPKAKMARALTLQSEAVKALTRIGGKPAITVFVKVLNNKKARLSALQGLAEIGDHSAKPHIAALYLNTTDERVRGMASIAMQRIWSRWGPTEKEMGVPIYPGANYFPNTRAEWIFTTRDSLGKVANFYRQRLKKPPMNFKTFKKIHERSFNGSKETMEGLPSERLDVIFIVEEQLFKGKKYPSKLIFLKSVKSSRKKTEIQIYHAAGG